MWFLVVRSVDHRFRRVSSVSFLVPRIRFFASAKARQKCVKSILDNTLFTPYVDNPLSRVKRVKKSSGKVAGRQKKRELPAKCGNKESDYIKSAAAAVDYWKKHFPDLDKRKKDCTEVYVSGSASERHNPGTG